MINVLKFFIEIFFSVLFQHPVEKFYEWLYNRLKMIERPYDIFVVIILAAIGIFNACMLYQCIHASYNFLGGWW